jgi:hypothetical protein
MYADRFDEVVRGLSAPDRRRMLGLGLGGVLASLGLAGAEAKKKRKKKKKKCKGETKKCGKKCIPSSSCCSSADCGGGATCQNGTCTPLPTCSDEVKNGSESDVDCGGSCPRCGNGKTCAGPDDCSSAFCANGTCQSCSGSQQCGEDGHGQCFCEQIEGGSSACNSATDPESIVDSCDECAAGLNCLDLGNEAWCVYPCGAA